MIGETVSHYRILERLGEGGMGVVYRALDTKLEREVALKFLPPGHVKSEEAKKRFVKEAQTASAMDHPNICTIYEIDETDDGRLFLAMAYYEGDSLGALIESGPIEPEGALSIAQQIVQGLIKAHEKGIIHRDIKPGNILITSDGLVKIVDFGLAMLTGQTRITQAGEVLGTALYMSPEQIQGHEVDHRTDLWSLGVVLYEMVTGRLPFTGDYQQAVIYSIINNDPPPVSELGLSVPEELERVILSCLAKSPEDRYQSAQDLLNDLQTIGSILSPQAGRGPEALAEVTARTAGSPYPGLASFSESESAFFFGREAEIESLWNKLPDKRLLAVIGPSGTGKTSYLKAGVIPAAPADWSTIFCTPGGAPFISLRQALVPVLAGDTNAIRELISDDDISSTMSAFASWNRLHSETLIILDQFEELFTLNSSETQLRFTELLEKLMVETDIRIIISIRDDFLFSCHEFPSLKPVFESLVPLGPLTGQDLRRALIEPAARSGYRFDDESLVDEIISEVEGERGVLPLLAFAMSILWEKRDRGKHLLTRQAYDSIGGVSGALARHAESTMERIGAGRQQMVRELFRNLVTSKTTRIARRRNELLSLFEDVEKDDADTVIRELTKARLLNSYEDLQEVGEDVRWIEIVHESLITSWPRLVGWQTQDEDSARLRDEVRQAAETWDAKERPKDLLWTGKLYQEIVLWRDRYPGALTSKEEAFYEATRARARQKKRRLATVIVSGFAIMAIVLLSITGLLKKSRNAERVAQANLLLSLSKDVADECPTTRIAYALASLERADSEETRKHALRTLNEGPCFSAFERNGRKNPWSIDVSPDGKYFAVGWTREGIIWLHHTDSDSTLQLIGQKGLVYQVLFSRDSKRLLASSKEIPSVTIWSIPDGKLLNTIKTKGPPWAYWSEDPDRILTVTARSGRPFLWQSWSLRDGSSDTLLEEGMPFTGASKGPPVASPDCRWVADFIEKDIMLYSLSDPASEPVTVGSHDQNVVSLKYNPTGDRLASSDFAGNIRIWDMADPAHPVLNQFRCPPDEELYLTAFDNRRERVAAFHNDGTVRVWDLDDRSGTKPLSLAGNTHWAQLADFFDDGRWIISTHNAGNVVTWYLGGKYPEDIQVKAGIVGPIQHLPDGSAIIELIPGQNGLEFWQISMDDPDKESRMVFTYPRNSSPFFIYWNISPDGKNIALSPYQIDDPPIIISIAEGTSRQLDIPSGSRAAGAIFSPEGTRLLSAIVYGDSLEENTCQFVRLWDLVEGESRDLDIQAYYAGLGFRSETELISWSPISESGKPPEDYSETTWTWVVESWDIESGESRVIRDLQGANPMIGTPSGKIAIYQKEDGIYTLNHDNGEVRKIFSGDLHITNKTAINRDETLLAVGLYEGDIYLIPLDGSEAYFLGDMNRQPFDGMSFDPKGRWLATTKGIGSGEIRLWPIPDGPSKLYLKHDEFLELMRSQTNVRAVPDPESKNGFKLEIGKFAGFDKPPIR